ncbi:anti-sigma factor family protein [Martelella mangrovi]|uniref:Anti-sigma factor RsiW n=1 Tax=Martelella mangrovi TaxID=1397477 RepID=A0ABV2IGR9_9HYPH
MNSRSDRIQELDLLAYADGLLEDDPERKAAVETFLDSNPSAREFVEEVRRQNDLLRQVCLNHKVEPVPAHLRAAVWNRQARTGANLARAASLAAALAGAGLLGYFYDELRPHRASLPASFMDTVTLSENFISRHPVSTVTGQAGPLENRLWLAFPAPDLSSEGYRLVSRVEPTTSQDGVVRLTYQGANGKTLKIFLQPSQDMVRSRTEVQKSGDTIAHFMSVGPMTVALTTDAEDLDAGRIANTVETSIRGLRFSSPDSTIAASVDNPLDSASSDFVAPTIEN